MLSVIATKERNPTVLRALFDLRTSETGAPRVIVCVAVSLINKVPFADVVAIYEKSFFPIFG